MTFLLALITTWHCYIHICVLFLVPLSHQNVSAVQGPWPYVCSHIPEPTIGPRTDQALGSAVFVYYLTGDSCSVLLFVVVVIPLLSCVWLFETPWTAARQASLFFTISQSLFKLMCTEVVMPSNHLILCRPLLLLPLMCPSIRVFSKESALCIRLPKYYTRLFEAQRSKVTHLWSLG